MWILKQMMDISGKYFSQGRGLQSPWPKYLSPRVKFPNPTWTNSWWIIFLPELFEKHEINLFFIEKLNKFESKETLTSRRDDVMTSQQDCHRHDRVGVRSIFLPQQAVCNCVLQCETAEWDKSISHHRMCPS